MVQDKNTEKHIDNAIKHFKRKKDELEAHQTKAALITLRKSFIENQKRHNYNNEYERLIGVLTNKAITHSGNNKQFEERVKQLEQMGARAVTGLNGNKKKQTYDEIMNEVNKKKSERVTINTLPGY